MSKTLTEHIGKGFTVVSEQRKQSYSVPGEVAFGKVVQGILGYEAELKHTSLPQQKEKLKGLVRKAQGSLEEFLGSPQAVEEAIDLWKASTDKTSQKRFEQGFSDVLGTAWREGKI